jgi:hypothetical protein
MVQRFARYFQKELMAAARANVSCPLDLSSNEIDDDAMM